MRKGVIALCLNDWMKWENRTTCIYILVKISNQMPLNLLSPRWAEWIFHKRFFLTIMLICDFKISLIFFSLITESHFYLALRKITSFEGTFVVHGLLGENAVTVCSPIKKNYFTFQWIQPKINLIKCSWNHNLGPTFNSEILKFNYYA